MMHNLYLTPLSSTLLPSSLISHFFIVNIYFCYGQILPHFKALCCIFSQENPYFFCRGFLWPVLTCASLKWFPFLCITKVTSLSTFTKLPVLPSSAYLILCYFFSFVRLSLQVTCHILPYTLRRTDTFTLAKLKLIHVYLNPYFLFDT